MPPRLRSSHNQGQPFCTPLARSAGARRRQGRKELDRSCSTKVVCTALPPWHSFYVPLAGHHRRAREARGTSQAGDPASAILRRILCHAGNDWSQGPPTPTSALVLPAIDPKGPGAVA